MFRRYPAARADICYRTEWTDQVGNGRVVAVWSIRFGDRKHEPFSPLAVRYFS